MAIKWTLEITNFYIAKSSVTNNILCLSNSKVYYGKETQYNKNCYTNIVNTYCQSLGPLLYQMLCHNPGPQICESDTFSPSIVTLEPTF